MLDFVYKGEYIRDKCADSAINILALVVEIFFLQVADHVKCHWCLSFSREKTNDSFSVQHGNDFEPTRI